VIARGSNILFARGIPVGGDHFNRAVASALKMSLEDAKVLRIKVCSLGAPAPAGAGSPEAQHRAGRGSRAAVARPGVPTARCGHEGRGRRNGDWPVAGCRALAGRLSADPVSAELLEKARLVDQACREPLSKLTEELDLCRRYHESTFSTRPIDRLVFVGGEARHRNLCQQIARQMSLAAQVGDPLVRMGRTSDVGVESGIDRRQPQPSWAVAIGLSMGPSGGEPAPGKK
jgi:Tfp pilus assembly PilM family ATPase